MAPKKVDPEPTFKPTLINVAGSGLGWRDRERIFKSVSRVA